MITRRAGAGAPLSHFLRKNCCAILRGVAMTKSLSTSHSFNTTLKRGCSLASVRWLSLERSSVHPIRAASAMIKLSFCSCSGSTPATRSFKATCSTMPCATAIKFSGLYPHRRRLFRAVSASLPASSPSSSCAASSSRTVGVMTKSAPATRCRIVRRAASLFQVGETVGRWRVSLPALR